jgi:hypothetical protein
VPLSALAPDQRAVLQLVLQRERSYGQIAELLGISEDAVRARAHAGLAALAPSVELPGDKVAQVGDFLLGQQNGKPRQATRRLLRESEGAREWADTVAAALRGVDGASVPDIPSPRAPKASEATAAAPADTVASVAAPAEAQAEAEPPRPRPRPLREPAAAAPGEPSAPGPRSSRLGGALLIGAVVLALVALLLWLFVFSGDDKSKKPTKGAAATPTATPTPQPVGQLELKGTGSASKATGRIVFYLQGSQLLFALEAQDLPQTRSSEKYALWLTGGAKAKWLGDTPAVGKDGALTVAGPGQAGAASFAKDFSSHRNLLLTRETGTKRTRPGPTLLRGTLPRGQS